MEVVEGLAVVVALEDEEGAAVVEAVSAVVEVEVGAVVDLAEEEVVADAALVEVGAVADRGEVAAAVEPKAVASREAKQLLSSLIVTREFSLPEERKTR